MDEQPRLQRQWRCLVQGGVVQQRTRVMTGLRALHLKTRSLRDRMARQGSQREACQCSQNAINCQTARGTKKALAPSNIRGSSATGAPWFAGPLPKGKRDNPQIVERIAPTKQENAKRLSKPHVPLLSSTTVQHPAGMSDVVEADRWRTGWSRPFSSSSRCGRACRR